MYLIFVNITICCAVVEIWNWNKKDVLVGVLYTVYFYSYII